MINAIACLENRVRKPLFPKIEMDPGFYNGAPITNQTDRSKKTNTLFFSTHTHVRGNMAGTVELNIVIDAAIANDLLTVPGGGIITQYTFYAAVRIFIILYERAIKKKCDARVV